MDSTQLMEKVAQVSPEVHQFLLETADEVKESPFREEIVAELDGIMKTAAVNWGQMAQNAGQAIGKGARNLGGALAGAAVGGVALALAGDVYDAAKRGLTKTRDYKAMLASNPDLKDRPAAQVQQLFSTLHRFNPDFASDPMVAGTFVRNQVEMGMGPDISTLSSLISSRKNIHDTKKFVPFGGSKKG